LTAKRRPGIRTALALSLLAASGCWVDAQPEDAETGVPQPARATTRPAHEWPPVVGEPYPDLALLTPQGERVMLSSLRGRVLLVEPIGLDCPACNAFAGANEPGVGGFQGTSSQRGLPSVPELLRSYGVDPADPRLVHVQLLLYDMTRTRAPSPKLARLWAQHFGFGDAVNEVVLVGEDYLIGPASYDMIPGFHVVGADFELRWDSSGHTPLHDLWREVLPALPEMLAEVGAPPGSGG
jgi:hypothetical protein